jgi:DNA-directed RNA polymerase subunit beta
MSGKPLTYKRLRKNFGKIKKIVEIPDLIGMQRGSYNRLLQMDVPPEKRQDIGLQAVFKSVYPINDFTGTASLEFVSYSFGEVKHSVNECIHRGMTYEIPIRIRIRLVVYDLDKETGISNIRDIKEQEIYFGTIPLMTEKGTFIINGTERVVVSQLHRSSGVFFDHDKGKTHSSGKIIYTARVIPVRGSWIDMEIDPKDIVYIRIDRRRKFPVTLLFKAFGYTTEDILDYFYEKETIFIKNKEFFRGFNEKTLKGQRSSCDVADPKTGEVIVKQGRIFTKRAIKQIMSAGMDMVPITEDDVLEKFLASLVIDNENNDVIGKPAEIIDQEVLDKIMAAGIEEFDMLLVDVAYNTDSIRKTLLLDKVDSKAEALIEIYRRLRPGKTATTEVALVFIYHKLF